MTPRRCAADRATDREPCRAAPLRDSLFCRLHDPAHAEEVAAARRLGGLRSSKDATLSTAYDLRELDTPQGIRRLLDIAVFDALALDNGVARIRLLIAATSTAIRLFEATEVDRRLRTLETLHVPYRPPGTTSLLDGQER